MKFTKLFILLLFPTLAFAQKKPVRYFDENLSPISKAEYKKGEKEPNVLLLDFDLDTAVYYVKAKREHSGQLPAETMQALRKNLEAVSTISVPDDHLIVIDYYPGPDRCNSSGTNDQQWIKSYHEAYLKKLHETPNVSQYYLYNTKEGLERYEGIYTWYPDLENLVMQTFFKLHYPCGSVVVIRPDGQYKSFFGEYSSEYVCTLVRGLSGF